MTQARIEAAARRADLAIAELAEAVKGNDAAAAKVIEANRQYIAGFVGLLLHGDMLEWAVRLPSKRPES